MIRKEWERFRDRCIWSWDGWVETWRNEHSLQQWLWANLASGTLAMVLDLTGGERALILALGILTLAAELMNTAIERTVDYISEDRHPLAKAAKDCGSAAVAVTGIAAGVAWLAILAG